MISIRVIIRTEGKVKQISTKSRLKVRQTVKQMDRAKGGTLKMGKNRSYLKLERLNWMASLEGFEPTTRCLEVKGSNFRDFYDF